MAAAPPMASARSRRARSSSTSSFIPMAALPPRRPIASGPELARGDAVVDDHVGARRRVLDHGDHGRELAPLVRGAADYVLELLPVRLTECNLPAEAGRDAHAPPLGRSELLSEAALLAIA